MLPDYEKNSRLIRKETCDNGNTQTAYYKSYDENGKIAYRLYVTTTPSNTIFYELLYELLNESRTRLLMKKDGVLTEMTHSDWDTALETEGPNYYRMIHSGPSDCKDVAK